MNNDNNSKNTMDRGWVKNFRQIKDWEWYKKPIMSHLFQHLIREANHKDNKWNGIIIKRGQLATGRESLAKDTGLSIQQVRTCLNRMKKSQELTIKSTNQFSIITICNYDKYQNPEEINNQRSNHQITSDQPANNQQLTTNKNDKNVKNEKNKDIYSREAQAVLDFLNEKTGRRYQRTDEITARLKEGKTVQECKQIISNKIQDEYFIENPNYLNPVTLFRKSHWDKYLNAQPTINTSVSRITEKNIRSFENWEPPE